MWVQCHEMAANIFSYIIEPATSISILNQREICSHTSLLLGITSTPSVQGCLCNFFDAWSQQCPELMDEVFGKDHHTVRFSSRNWTGTRSDMSIEESVMREAKTSGGIGHGALSHEDALGSWFLFIEHTSKVSEDYAGSICR